jgi:HEAT repeat protein
MRAFRRSILWGAGIAAIVTLVLGCLAGWRLEEEICIRRLDSSDEAEREAAAERLARMKSSRAVPKLVPLALEVGQSYAEDALLAIGAASVSPLLEELDGSHSPAQGEARTLLAGFGLEAAGEFVAGAGHDRKEVRILSVGVLRRYVKERPDVYATLVRALDDPEWEVRHAAVWSLVTMKGRETEVLHLLMGRLLDPDEEPTVEELQSATRSASI